MRIGIPRELKPREGRVGLIPAACVELVRDGHEVFVEHSAGEKSGYSDQSFRDVGVTVLPSADELFAKSQMIVKVKEPIEADLARLRREHLLFCYLHLAALPELTRRLCSIGLTAVALGAGVAGGNSALVAAGLGAEVIVFDKDRDKMVAARAMGPNVTALYP